MGLFADLMTAIEPLTNNRAWNQRRVQQQNAGILDEKWGQKAQADFNQHPRDQHKLTGGSGIMGKYHNELGPQYQVDLGRAAATTPGYEDLGFNMMNQGFGEAGAMGRTNSQNNAAMNRQIQDQQWAQNNMTAYQREQARLSAAGMNRDQQNQYFSRLEGLQKTWSGQVQPYQGIIQSTVDMDAMLDEAGSYEDLAGTDQLLSVIRYMDIATGGEAFMSDDMRNVARSHGFVGGIEGLRQWIAGEGFMKPEFVKDMHERMQQMSEVNQRRIDELAKNTRTSLGLSPEAEAIVRRGDFRSYKRPKAKSRTAKPRKVIDQIEANRRISRGQLKSGDTYIIGNSDKVRTVP